MLLLKNERGMVLLLVLLVVALLATVLTELSFSTLVDMRLAETFRDTTRATYLSRGGLEVGKMLLQDDDNNYDATDELWAIGIQQYPVADGAVTIEISDLSGRIGLNRLIDLQGNDSVTKARYLRLLEELDVDQPEALVGALIDWIDTDEDEETPGAENSYYISLAEPYQCKDGPLDTLDELVLVKGYSPELLELLRPHVTAYGYVVTGSQVNVHTININTASREVLLSLSADMTDFAAETLLAARQEEPFTAKSQVAEQLGGVENPVYGSISGYIDFKSQNYQVASTGWVNDGRMTLLAVVEKVNNKTKIKFQRVL